MTGTECAVAGCGRTLDGTTGGGLCNMHYKRLRRLGDVGSAAPVLMRGEPVAVRFWAKVNRDSELGCWEWSATRTSNGYGRFFPKGSRAVVAHRFAYELLVGPIPDGLQLDHLCRNRACCNPLHLEPVTPAENQRRGDSPAGRNARKTHCDAGHPLAGANLYRRPSDPEGTRGECRTCRARYSRERNAS